MVTRRVNAVTSGHVFLCALTPAECVAKIEFFDLGFLPRFLQELCSSPCKQARTVSFFALLSKENQMAVGVNPVFFLSRDIPNVSSDRPITVLEVCLSAEKVAGQGSIVGAQNIGGLWRVYPATREARSVLLVQGLRIRGVAQQLKNTNPFILKNESGEEKPSTKVWIDNVPISVADSEIEHSLLKNGCELRSRIKSERARDSDNKLTRFLTGRRFVYITIPPVPLDKSIKVSVFNAKVYHREQKLEKKTIVCSRCLEEGHHSSTCTKDVVCRACKQPGHRKGDHQCEAIRNVNQDREKVVCERNERKERKEHESSGERGEREKEVSEESVKQDRQSRGRTNTRQTTLRPSLQLSTSPRRRSETPKRRRSGESSPQSGGKKQSRRTDKISVCPPRPDSDLEDRETNFYIEDDLASCSASPPQRLCDVCADYREATHSCLQCQQRFCLPCHKYHDSFRACQTHTVVTLTQETEDRKTVQVSDNETTELCPKHTKQELLFHCNQCEEDICLQCKLTHHEGHPTQDLTVSRAKVKDNLKDRLTTLTAAVQQIDHLVTAFEDRCSKLQHQKQVTEQEVHARADTLHQWVNQSVDEAVSSIQSCSEQLTKPWKDQAEQLRNKKLALQAQHDHILQVLKDGKEADAVSLVAQLSVNPTEDVKVKEMEKELTKDIPTLRVEHSTTAVNQPQLRFFIGVLEPVQQTSGPEDTPLPIQPTSVQGKTSGGVSVKGSDLRHSAHSGISANSGMAKVGKKPPREFFCSKNPESVVGHMCPISNNRLWVIYKTSPNSPLYLKLFDADGQVLTTEENPRQSNGLHAITDDVILSWKCGDSTVQLITPDGRQSSYDMGMEVRYFASSTTNDVHYMIEYNKRTLHSVKFTSANTDQTDPTTAHSAMPHPKPPAVSPLRNQLTHTVSDVVFDETPSGMWPRHVSAGGRYFAVLKSDTVKVYARAESRRPVLTCSYQTKNRPTDVRFCQVDGQEMMLVSVRDDNKLHVIDHTDGGRFVRYLDTGPLNLDRPQCLATDFDQHVWIGCRGGKVVVVDL